ncbi:bifunctional [glutamine synthetase] adenylyltransferase/[glutamine synthetase]-adenylyl-L-tyrosine phosphorylase [Corynebacterium halotolerans]|uniref:Bifunctional glutamine synthetase adenylyltransferase/adenylyl-removing enzyme n=1 Tax=Corynebacterium halotolerans YIM 70093 = DSM 44683 TaxID=1121362 RepID=M1P8K7_9CORY|nr:bifunctional [glutamine synthetase] adenylyltransferase/[glutamine synthetase]-adenylyl-L-tyrosine phosphorylase [Corynebacterium halotolerans]AGF72986.1 bifunctional glutamine-synthetase adenylyltransferase/deadenyltransferase [Corynebacterium halotolerans YIM 70093 = DSM 44683]
MPPSPRSTVPSPAVLGLTGPHAADDLAELGWNNEDSLDLLWTLAGTGSPNLALNTLTRLMRALGDRGGELDRALRADASLRIRLLALLGGSTALGDLLVANPSLWRELTGPLPTGAEMMRALLGVVDARPATVTVSDDTVADRGPDTAREDLSTPGTYRAGIHGPAAEKALKLTYRTLLMRIAAHDLAGTFAGTRNPDEPHIPFTTVTGLLTDLADAALTAALAVAVAGVYGEADVDTRLAVMAMGKCGAGELNYISDVDVIHVAEPPTQKATRLAGECMRIGTRAFFEVDANLRPEGKSGAVVRTLDSHVAYYERWAATWEFQALLKARAQTGYLPLGQAYLEKISPMVWTASQRDSFVDDVQAMRRRVLENVPEALRTRELKLGVGGLRDVEFAVQLLQLVHGRSDESLRVLSTVDALQALVAGGYIGRDDGHQLIDAYEFLRLLEHRLQLHRLRRTHTMPPDEDDEHLACLAATSGFHAAGKKSGAQVMQDRLRRIRLLISELHSRLFYRPLLHSVVAMSVDELKLSPAAAKLQLAALGYRHPGRAFEHLTALAAGATRKAKIQAMLMPTLMDWLSTTADPDAGLLNYRKLSDAAHDRAWFLRMLRDEGIVGQRLMRILGTSPFTADLIIAAPDFVRQLGDTATGPRLKEVAPDQLNKALVAASKRHSDPDRAVAVARSLRRVELARIASADLLDLMGTAQVCTELSYVWDAVLQASLLAEVRWSLWRHGLEEPPARIAIIGMGRLGGAELGFGSDADVLFVCEPAPGVDDGEAVKWATAICDGMRARLARPSDDPPLEVDLGLRPEGRSGATVRTLGSYERYYRQWGEVWEIQALLRATHVAGDPELGERFLRMIDEFRYPDQGASAADIREIRRIKARIDNERLPRGADRNTHTKLGRGALTDIEWTVQLLTMMHAHEYPGLHNTSTLETLEVLEAEGILDAWKVAVLRDAWLMATDARNALVLVRGKRMDQLPQPGPALAQVAGAAGWDPEDYQGFLETYLKLTRRARKVVDEVFWGEGTREP